MKILNDWPGDARYSDYPEELFSDGKTRVIERGDPQWRENRAPDSVRASLSQAAKYHGFSVQTRVLNDNEIAFRGVMSNG